MLEICNQYSSSFLGKKGNTVVGNACARVQDSRSIFALLYIYSRFMLNLLYLLYLFFAVIKL